MILLFPGKATSPKRPGPFGSLGLPDWVYGPRGLRDPMWDDSSDCTLSYWCQIQTVNREQIQNMWSWSGLSSFRSGCFVIEGWVEGSPFSKFATVFQRLHFLQLLCSSHLTSKVKIRMVRPRFRRHLLHPWTVPLSPARLRRFGRALGRKCPGPILLKRLEVVKVCESRYIVNDSVVIVASGFCVI